MAALVSQLKEGDEKKNTELQKERDELARLKEIEGLKNQHRTENTQVTEASQAEIVNAKRDFEGKCTQEITEVEHRLNAEIDRQNKMLETTDRINKIMEEQAELTAGQMSAWNEIVDMLNHDMESKCRNRLPTYLLSKPTLPLYRISLLFDFSGFPRISRDGASCRS